MAFCTDDGKTACLLNLLGELDVGTTTCHVGSDGNGAEHALLEVLAAVFFCDLYHALCAATSLCHDVCLLLVELGVEHLVRNLAHVEHLRDKLRELYRCGTYEHRATAVAHLYDFVDNGCILLAVGLVYTVVEVLAEHRTVCRNLYNVELVDIPELACLCRSSTGHTSELVVHTEVVLQCDGSECLCGCLHLYVLLSLYSLVESVAPAAAFHDTACLLVDNLHLAVHNNVLVVLVEHGVSLQQLLQGMYTLRLYGVVVEHGVLLVEALLLAEVFLVLKSREL